MKHAFVRALALSLPLLACAPQRGAHDNTPRVEPTIVAASSEVPVIEVVAVHDDAPAGGDGAPRLTLAFLYRDGTRIPIEGEATSYVPFRRGVALVDTEHRLVLSTPEGARSVLALDAGAPPARGPRGELVYVARHDLEVEVHVLDEDGRDRVVARELGSAGMLAPQADGRLFFIATPRGGGVAGLWLTERGQSAARCLTNCELETGAPLDDRFVPLPEDAHAISASTDRVEWNASDGTRRSVALLPSVDGEGGSTVPFEGREAAP
jgi:hypothetical protein